MANAREQLAELEQIIKERKVNLLAEIRREVNRARDENYGVLAGPVTDTGDAASADLLSDLDNAEVTRDLGEIRELDAALARLEAGTYGVCSDCGGEIDFERLLAHPVAVRCFDCQEVHERTHSHPAESKL